MKTTITVVVLALLATGFYMFQKNDVKNEAALGSLVSGEISNGTFELATSSQVVWKGEKPMILGYFDEGTLNIEKGSFEVVEGNIASGSFTFDMSSIKASKTGSGQGNEMLEKHLKADDFFGIEKFPTAQFVITKSETVEGNLKVFGDLTIKGITKPVEFNATVSETDGVAEIQADINLDRTLWDIRYGSGSFFENLGDKVISDTFNVKLDLSASKKI